MKSAVNVAINRRRRTDRLCLAFRVAAGSLFGPDTRVNLHLLEITRGASRRLARMVMEPDTTAPFPTLNKVVPTDDARVAFRDCQAALLVGARPRGPGMERKDLLLANAQNPFPCRAGRSTKSPTAT